MIKVLSNYHRTLTTTTTLNIKRASAKKVSKLDAAALHKTYLEQDEFIVVDNFLSPEVMGQWDKQVEALKPHIHRNFIPKHKKGGSVGYDTVSSLAPAMRLGKGRSASYGDVLRKLVQSGRFGHEDVTRFPWTEIDFPNDVERAANEVLPAIEKLPA